MGKENDEPVDLRAQRVKFLPKNISRDEGNTKINGGIGDGVNDGGSAYQIDVEEDTEEDEKTS
jgi:hypothetical protein